MEEFPTLKKYFDIDPVQLAKTTEGCDFLLKFRIKDTDENTRLQFFIMDARGEEKK